MTPKTFATFINETLRRWNPHEGVIVLLRDPFVTTATLRLCVPGDQPNELSAENCLLWKDDESIYVGKIRSEELKELLTKHNVCHVIFTAARRLASASKDKANTFCYGNKEKCKGVHCKLKCKDVKRVPIQST